MKNILFEKVGLSFWLWLSIANLVQKGEVAFDLKLLFQTVSRTFSNGEGDSCLMWCKSWGLNSLRRPQIFKSFRTWIVSLNWWDLWLAWRCSWVPMCCIWHSWKESLLFRGSFILAEWRLLITWHCVRQEGRSYRPCPRIITLTVCQAKLWPWDPTHIVSLRGSVGQNPVRRRQIEFNLSKPFFPLSTFWTKEMARP